MPPSDDLRQRVENLERRVREIQTTHRKDQRTWLDIGPFTLGLIVVVVLLFIGLLVLGALNQT